MRYKLWRCWNQSVQTGKLENCVYLAYSGVEEMASRLDEIKMIGDEYNASAKKI